MPMMIAQKLSELLRQPVEPGQGLPRTLYRIISPGLSGLEIALAVTIIIDMMAKGGTINPETARAITDLIEDWDRFKLLPNPAEALAIILVIHKGGNSLMSIIVKMIQPLLNAQREIGRTEGLTEGRTEGLTESNARWRDWLDRKATAEAQGEDFNEPPPDERE